jgi:hypothetical protein
MQKFIGMMITEHRAARGIYITTSDFTEPAKRLAREHNIKLWNGSKLANLLIEQRKKMQERTQMSRPSDHFRQNKMAECDKSLNAHWLSDVIGGICSGHCGQPYQYLLCNI